MAPKKTTARAEYNGTKLVLNLPDAIHPTMWQYDMSYVPGASFEIVPDGAAHCLRMKTSTGTVHTIALYDTKETATQILSMIIGAMATPGKPAKAATTDKPASRIRTPILTAVSLILFILLSTIMFDVVTVPHQDPRISTPQTPQQNLPQNAQDVLKERLHK